MFICPCRRNVNVWHVLAALIWGDGRILKPGYFGKTWFRFILQYKHGKSQQSCVTHKETERNTQREAMFYNHNLYRFVNWACLLFSVNTLACWLVALQISLIIPELHKHQICTTVYIYDDKIRIWYREEEGDLFILVRLTDMEQISFIYFY